MGSATQIDLLANPAILHEVVMKEPTGNMHSGMGLAKCYYLARS